MCAKDIINNCKVNNEMILVTNYRLRMQFIKIQLLQVCMKIDNLFPSWQLFYVGIPLFTHVIP